MIKVSSKEDSIIVNIYFVTPIFDWHGVSTQFFELIYSALTPKFIISPRDFTQTSGDSLGDIVVKYNFFGGKDFVSLSAENLSFNFVRLSPSDGPLILDIINSVESRFRERFPNCQYSTIRLTLFEHTKIVDDISVIDYLTRFSIPSVDEFCSETSTSLFPAGKFKIFENDWQATCTVEKSEIHENALFLHLDLDFLRVDTNPIFETMLNRVKFIYKLCTGPLELEWVN